MKSNLEIFKDTLAEDSEPYNNYYSYDFCMELMNAAKREAIGEMLTMSTYYTNLTKGKKDSFKTTHEIAIELFKEIEDEKSTQEDK